MRIVATLATSAVVALGLLGNSFGVNVFPEVPFPEGGRENPFRDYFLKEERERIKEEVRKELRKEFQQALKQKERECEARLRYAMAPKREEEQIRELPEANLICEGNNCYAVIGMEVVRHGGSYMGGKVLIKNGKVFLKGGYVPSNPTTPADVQMLMRRIRKL